MKTIFRSSWGLFLDLPSSEQAKPIHAMTFSSLSPPSSDGFESHPTKKRDEKIDAVKIKTRGGRIFPDFVTVTQKQK